MTIHLIHGFNVSDGGRETIRRLQPYLTGAELPHDYGWTGLLALRCTNAWAVRHISPKIRPGDTLIGHSNGALICYQLAQRFGTRLAAVVAINPALRRDTVWPEGLPVLCLHNSTDWVVQLGRVWSRLVSLGGMRPHGWGAAGRYGFTSGQRSVSNWDTAASYWGCPVRGHSGIFKPEPVAYWGPLIDGWAGMHAEGHRSAAVTASLN